MGKKGQVSIEILSIVGFVLFLFIPLILVSLSKANEIETNSAMEKELFMLKQITTASELVYSSSTGTEMKVFLFFPKEIKSIKSEDANDGTYIILKDKYGNEITDFTKAKVYIDNTLNPASNELEGNKIVLIKKQYDNINKKNEVLISLYS